MHSQYSPDGTNPVSRLADHATTYGLDWLVIPDHGGVAHQKLSLDQVTTDIEQARKALPDTLVFERLEWSIPGAEHGTVSLPLARTRPRCFGPSTSGSMARSSSPHGVGRPGRTRAVDRRRR